ncbi:LacI family DNA-binding transcriptional regulator [Verrucomicrobiota bacterium sgz303538]
MNPPQEEASTLRGEKGPSESRVPRKLGDLPQKTITMAQIAKAAGVSQGAISSLLNDRDYGIRVSEKTRERVFKVCREMGYIPNDLRAVVRMYPELGDFCLLVSSSVRGGLTHPFVARIAQTAAQTIGDSSHPLTIAFYDERTDYSTLEIDDLPHPVRAGVTSKFLCYGTPNLSLFQVLTRRGLPVISLGADVHQPGVLSLVPDYPKASRLAIEQLFKLGHQHIAIVSGPFGTTDSVIIELHQGVKHAYDASGVPIEAQNIVYTDLSYNGGKAAMDELLGHPVKPTAIFCLSDLAAAGVIARAQERGLKVPEDLSVLGCSDDPCSLLMSPALTTVHIPAEKMAETAIHEAERLVQEGPPAEPRKQVLPVHLLERASIAAVPASVS